ncbi:hypothetical protein L1987_15706 [Smallanthus sonchifolius]|uniref:Uncharacterized protein n=1 Tax=Smallanthus sonchifolius TaxID=185202 RepID=A0ACB9J7C2_9ASTR|nr:hypothetical protein L1987_15706 [Smallanthus sonchifolius]
MLFAELKQPQNQNKALESNPSPFQKPRSYFKPISKFKISVSQKRRFETHREGEGEGEGETLLYPFIPDNSCNQADSEGDEGLDVRKGLYNTIDGPMNITDQYEGNDGLDVAGKGLDAGGNGLDNTHEDEQ